MPSAIVGELRSPGVAFVKTAAFRKWLLWLLAIAAAGAIGASYGSSVWNIESTDDAEIDGHLNPISSRISGVVATVDPNIEDNQFVKAGTVLAEIDPSDYQAVRERAEADVAVREAAAQSAEINVPMVVTRANSAVAQAEAAVQESTRAVAAAEAARDEAIAREKGAQAAFELADRDRERYQELVEKREIARADYDAKQTAADTARYSLEASRAAVSALEQQLAELRSRVEERQSELAAANTAPDWIADTRERARLAGLEEKRAEADLRIARLNLSYTRVVAPVSGVVGHKSVERGQHVDPGQLLLAIIPLDDIWVTANYKETQLKRMRPGQPVRITVDTYGREYQGHVDSVAAATGSKFSLLPPENASGNYVKVAQRIPVRIRFDKGQDTEQLLRPGMSVVTRVNVQ